MNRILLIGIVLVIIGAVGAAVWLVIFLISVYDINRWLKQAEIACAMTLEALIANLKPYDGRLHELRGFKGAVTCAANGRFVRLAKARSGSWMFSWR